MMRSYFVWFKIYDSVIVDVDENIDRPNNEDCDSVLETWVSENYGDVEYEYFSLEHCRRISL